ncbi:MAG TPA: hypothetical protein VGQ83_17620 [Polyangia bacterium]
MPEVTMNRAAPLSAAEKLILDTLLAGQPAAAEALARELLRSEPDNGVALALRSFALGEELAAAGELARAGLRAEYLAHAARVVAQLAPERVRPDPPVRQIQLAALADAHGVTARERYAAAGSPAELAAALRVVDDSIAVCGSTRALREVRALCLLRLGQAPEAEPLIDELLRADPAETRALRRELAAALRAPRPTPAA